MILIDGGYIRKEDTGYAYHHYIKDHLGSNRMVVKVNSGIQQVQHYYPFGLSFAEATNRSYQPYKYNGKELVSDEGLNWYDYLARVYDPALLIFTTMDPMAEKYYSISPYAYCGNNPVKFVDPDGREWKNTQDEKIAKQLQQRATKRNNSLAKKEAKINAKIEKIKNNAKLSTKEKTQQIAKQQGKLDNVQTQRTILSNFNEGITQLGNSKTVYTFNTVVQGTTATLSSLSDGTIVINNYGTVGNRAHEITHAIQFDNGKISFNPMGSNNALMQNPFALELQSYGIEYSITNGIVPSSDAKHPRSVLELTLQWLYGLKDPNTGIYIYRPENYK